MANCKYCGKEVTWLKEGRKVTPVEGDGSVHKCEQYQKSRNSLKKMTREELDPELVKYYEELANKKK